MDEVWLAVAGSMVVGIAVAGEGVAGSMVVGIVVAGEDVAGSSSSELESSSDFLASALSLLLCFQPWRISSCLLSHLAFLRGDR